MVVTLDDKIMEDNIFRVVVSLCVMCDVYKRCCVDVSMLPLLLSSNKRRNQKQQKLKQEQKRGATCLRKRNPSISSEEIEELSLSYSLSALLSTPPILFVVIIIHGSGEVFHLVVVCLEWEQE